jgi:hypothetical protein
MGDGLPLPVLSFVPGVSVELPSLPVSAFSICRSLTKAKKLFVAADRGFW